MSFDLQDANEGLVVDVDTSAFNDENQITGGVVPDGYYHAVVANVEKEQSGPNPAIKLTFMVLAGTVAGQADREVVDFLLLTEKAKVRVLLFAECLGLIGPSALGQPNVRKNWGDAKGQQVIIETATREYKKKDGSMGIISNLTFAGIWPLDDPRLAKVPRGCAV